MQLDLHVIDAEENTTLFQNLIKYLTTNTDFKTLGFWIYTEEVLDTIHKHLCQSQCISPSRA